MIRILERSTTNLLLGKHCCIAQYLYKIVHRPIKAFIVGRMISDALSKIGNGSHILCFPVAQTTPRIEQIRSIAFDEMDISGILGRRMYTVSADNES
jgi:hypothetical protein